MLCASLKKYIITGHKIIQTSSINIKTHCLTLFYCARLRGTFCGRRGGGIRREIAEAAEREKQAAALVAKAVAEKEKEASEKAKKDKEYEMSMGGYMQVLYSDVQNQPAGTGANWNISRARFTLKKKLNDRASFYSQYNANTTDQNNAQFAIVDMYFDYRLSNDLAAQLGQIYGNASHDMNALWDTRDLGLRLQHKRKGGKFDYSLAVASGAGILSVIQRPDTKTVFRRIAASPTCTGSSTFTGFPANATRLFRAPGRLSGNGDRTSRPHLQFQGKMLFRRGRILRKAKIRAYGQKRHAEAGRFERTF